MTLFLSWWSFNVLISVSVQQSFSMDWVFNSRMCFYLSCTVPVLVIDWRMTDPNHPMNALMRLNQIQPGLQYRLLSQSGPVHAPVFTMSVEIHGTTYQATGNSKRTAKLQVALKVLTGLMLNKQCSVEQGFPNFLGRDRCGGILCHK